MAVVGSAYIVVNAITTGFQNQVQQAMNGLGGLGSQAGGLFGGGFSSGASGGLSKFQQEALNTYQSVNRLIEKSYYLQGAIGALIPVLGSVAAGITVMGLEAAAAGPSLMALAGVMAGLLQGMVAFKLAFGGIGKAIGQLTKPKTGGANDNMPQLLRAEVDANRALVKAKARVIEAQNELNEAYDIARNRIEDLNFATEDAVIGEKRAAIELEKARETLARVQDIPPNTRARREAELAFAQAELNLRKQKDRVVDLRAEQDKTTNNNKWNSKEQIANSKEVLNAAEAFDESIFQRTRAYDNLAIASKKVEDAQKGIGGAGQDALAGLNEYQKEFAKFIAGLKPKLDELKLAISETLFPPLQEAIQQLVDKLFPTLKEKLRDTGTAIGKSAKDFAALVTTPAGVKDLGVIMDTNNYVVGEFGTILGNITRLIETLLVAASPLTKRFTDWISAITGGWAKDAEGNVSGLTGMFNTAGDIAAGFGEAIGNVIGAFVDMGKAVTGQDGAGTSMLQWLIDLSQRFQDFTSKHLASGKLQEYFTTAWEGFKGILTIIGKIVEAILRAGGDKSLDGIVTSVGEGVTKVLDKMPELLAGGLAFAEFVGSFLGMLATFLESGSLQGFFGVVGKAIDILTAFLGIPGVTQLLLYAAAMHGVRLGIGRVAKGFETVGKYVAGDYLQLRKLRDNAKLAFGTVKTVASNTVTKLQAGFTALKNVPGQMKQLAFALKQTTIAQRILNSTMLMSPITWWIVGIVALIAILVVMYKKFEWFRDLVDAIWKGIKIAAEAVFNWLKDNWPIVLAILTGPIGLAVLAIVTFWDQIKGAVMAVFNWIKDNWQSILAILISPIGLAVTAIVGSWDTIKKAIVGVFNWVKDNWKLLVGVFTGPISLIRTAFEGLGTAIRNIVKGAINWVIKAWNGIQFGIPGFKLGPINFSGFTLKLPRIPELAEGGIVNPTEGGVLARIAEAGRPERVEPLDPDGLSKRDKAMIKMLSGGAGGGITVNVHPSAGMDEVELASLVSRQLAVQLRRGAA